jgi:hypothetical protein
MLSPAEGRFHCMQHYTLCRFNRKSQRKHTYIDPQDQEMTTSSQEIEHRSGDTKAGNATTKTTDLDRHGRDFRKHLITSAKTILSSIIDIVSDWVFYSRTKATLFLDEFNIPLLIFCIVSTIFGLLTVMGLSTRVWNDPRNNTASKSPTQGITRWFVGTKWGSWLLATNHLLACEIFLEE